MLFKYKYNCYSNTSVIATSVNTTRIQVYSNTLYFNSIYFVHSMNFYQNHERERMNLRILFVRSQLQLKINTTICHQTADMKR